MYSYSLNALIKSVFVFARSQSGKEFEVPEDRHESRAFLNFSAYFGTDYTC